MRVRAGSAVVGLILTLALVSCGDDEEVQRLSEAEFARIGNGICQQHIARIEEGARAQFGASREVPSAQQIEDFAERTVIPEIEKQNEELEKLKPPEDDEAEFKEYITESNRALNDEIGNDPSVILSEEARQDPFRKANDQAAELGLTECAQLTQRLRAASAARAK